MEAYNMAWPRKVALVLITLGFVCATVGSFYIPTSVSVDTRALSITGFIALSIAVILILCTVFLGELQSNLGKIIKIVAGALAIIGGVLFLASAALVISRINNTLARNTLDYSGTIAILGAIFAIIGGVFCFLDIVFGGSADTVTVSAPKA